MMKIIKNYDSVCAMTAKGVKIKQEREKGFSNVI